MEAITDLLSTLRDTAGFLVTGTAVMVFLLFAVLLWLWRGVAVKEDEEDGAG